MEEDKEITTFVERLERHLSQPKAPQTGRHRAAFIALRPLIDGALARGYTMKTVWAALLEDKKLSMTYQTFRTHCRQAGIGQGVQTGAAAPRRAPAGSRVAPLAAARPAADDRPRAFRHERVPRKEDIYG